MTYFIFYFILLTTSLNGMATLGVNYFSTILFCILFWIQGSNCIKYKVWYLYIFIDLWTYFIFYFILDTAEEGITLHYMNYFILYNEIEYQWYSNILFNYFSFYSILATLDQLVLRVNYFSTILFYILFWIQGSNYIKCKVWYLYIF